MVEIPPERRPADIRLGALEWSSAGAATRGITACARPATSPDRPRSCHAQIWACVAT